MNAVPFAARATADELLLIRPLEVEPRAVPAAGDLLLAEHDVIGAAGDLLEDRVLVVQSVAVLIDVRDLHRRPDRELAAVGLLARRRSS